jgi:O-acetyl-ADP-ribose deacetylase (regulator of RNase III)
MIEIVVRNIVDETTEAIVNAANEMLAAGSGISGAIHAAAGRHLEQECLQLGRCPTGEARITAGYDLKAKYVIHAVAPRYWDGTRGEAELLRETYQSIFAVALKNKIRSISIPAIGTGIYRFPLREATIIALETAKNYVNQVQIRFVCFDQKTAELYRHEASVLGLLGEG